MITAAEFLEWCAIFNVQFGGGSITIPVSIAQGGTGVTSVTTTPTASMWAGWDANKNLSANNFLDGYTSTATAAATTTLTVGSTGQQFFTGTTTQTVLLPVTSTLALGQSFYVVNNSTGIVTVQSSGGNTIQAMAAGTTLLVTCISLSGTTAASWSGSYNAQNPLGLFLRLSGGTMSGAINMGTNKISNMGDPTLAQDAMTLNYAGAHYLALSGGTMSGAINMGSQAITSLLNPVNPQDAMTLNYAGSTYLALAGGTMTGTINMGSHGISSLSNPVSAQDAVTLSYLQGAYLPLAGGTLSGTLNMGSNYITNLLDPVNAQDAATKNYVNNIAAGLSPVEGVYGASTGNLIGYTYNNGASGVGATLTAPSNGVFTQDGVSPPVASRWLYKNDTTYSGVANGIYTVTTSTGGSPAVLTRSNDYNVPADISPGDLISVEFGSVNQNSSWYQTAIVVTIGTSPIAFSVFFNPSSYVSSSLNSADILVGNGSNIATAVAVSGDLTLANTGAFTVVTIGGKAISLANSFTTSGNFAVTQTYTAPTNVTFPASGTLATTSQLPTPSALTEINDTNVTITLGGTPLTALLQAVSMTLGWTGQLSLTRGGTNASLTASNGGIVYSSGTALAILSGTATASQVMLSGASGAPSWSTATYPSSTTINQLFYSSSANTVTGLTTANNGILVTSSGGVPSILAGTGATGNILQSNAAAAPSFSTATYPSVATGTGTLLRANGTNWIPSTSTFADTYAVSTLLYASGSNAVTGLATANNASLSTNATGVPTWLPLTDGQIVIGSSAGAPLAATLSAGANVTITNGHNTITIAASGGTTSVNQNSSSATLANNSRYITNNGASLVTYTIPAGAAIGDTYEIIGGSSGGWAVAQPSSVICHYGNVSTTTGVSGSLSSTNQYDKLTISCIGTNTFSVYNVQGNITFV